MIRQTAFKLSTPRLLIRTAVIVVAALIWFLVASRLLEFGKTIDYSAMLPVGQQALDMLKTVNPYLWWVIVAIWTLIVYFCVRAWYDSSVLAGRAAPVPTASVDELASHLSEEVVDVLLWCWGTRDEPITIGDLHRTNEETRHGRIQKIAMVRQQESILLAQSSGFTAIPASRHHADAPGTRPAGAREVTPRTDVEPTLGSIRDPR